MLARIANGFQLPHVLTTEKYGYCFNKFKEYLEHVLPIITEHLIQKKISLKWYLNHVSKCKTRVKCLKSRKAILTLIHYANNKTVVSETVSK